MSKWFYPCATFGPLFIAMGLIYPPGWGFIVSLPGALMTMAALLMLYRQHASIQRMLSDATVKESSDG